MSLRPIRYQTPGMLRTIPRTKTSQVESFDITRWVIDGPESFFFSFCFGWVRRKCAPTTTATMPSPR